ncbi:AAA family ATPase [Trichocoleus sp. ST-U3]|uniref:AAA family ATPase n=1 Tax=Coleofasciculus sp. FACHB-542 TaxID=2692787 RepID=UPI001687FF82|nr:AAA family ATPase [Coleofasciculus sp. FACHB-542]MBD2083901.1 AAA family ATPase [Coleofasciculus sp. FACHB-542]
MAPLPPNRATTLKAAYRVCDVRPLEGENIQRYYVHLSTVRKTQAVEDVSTILDFQEAGEFTTLLFTGHRGCGKSTELRRIKSRWESDYRVIYLESDEEIDINDARYTDLYLVIIKLVEYELRTLGLKFDTQLLNSFESWFKDITEETETTIENSVGIETTAEAGAEIPFIAKLLAKVTAQIKGSEKKKISIREALERDISRLKSDINLLVSDGYKKLQTKFPHSKGFLIIFDNLDRVPPNVGNHLFFDYAAQLQELHCTIIYTVPISILYSEKNLNNVFDKPNIVPMVNIYEFERDRVDLDYNQKALDAVASLIEHRVEIEGVFESREPLLDLAKASGGHVRQLMQMMRTACQTASTRGHNKITVEDVTYAVKQEQFNFERVIPTEHYPLLAQVCINKDINKDEIGQLMLFNTSVLEYNGNNRWNYVNPVIKQIDAFQKALKQGLQYP